MLWLRYKSDHHTPLFRGADNGKAETSAPTCNKKTSCGIARVLRMCVFSCATLPVAFLLSSTCSQLELTVSWRKPRSVALIRRKPCSVAVAPKLSNVSHLFCLKGIDASGPCLQVSYTSLSQLSHSGVFGFRSLAETVSREIEPRGFGFFCCGAAVSLFCGIGPSLVG